MLTEYQKLPNASKVWIYQASRDWTEEEQKVIDVNLRTFLEAWESHGQQVFGQAILKHNRLIALIAYCPGSVSGCSTDSSVNRIKALGDLLNIDFFNRMNYLMVQRDRVLEIAHSDLTEAFNSGLIDLDTQVYNNLVKTKEELESSWLIPIKDSWHRKFIMVES